jgi:hypothetical protein
MLAIFSYCSAPSSSQELLWTSVSIPEASSLNLKAYLSKVTLWMPCEDQRARFFIIETCTIMSYCFLHFHQAFDGQKINPPSWSMLQQPSSWHWRGSSPSLDCTPEQRCMSIKTVVGDCSNHLSLAPDARAFDHESLPSDQPSHMVAARIDAVEVSQVSKKASTRLQSRLSTP